MFLSFELSLGDIAKHTSIQISIAILHLIKDLGDKVVNFILILFIEHWKCMCSNKTFE